jgi:L-seryl-tRNA(Ser) seleniumtransferase
LNLKNDLLKKIPSVDEILSLSKIKLFYESTSHQNIVECIREVLDDLRNEIIKLRDDEINLYNLCEKRLVNAILKKIEKKKAMSLRSVINATGVVLHTNLGRSLLSNEIKEAIWSVASEYSTLEMNVETGKRGSRYDHVEKLLCKLTDAESAIVVNNNAAAVILVLSALAKNKEVIVSRGELVEIGGSFRIPEVMAQSGAKLVEVGSTNKTHLRDYKNAITEDTGALLKVHTSNYRIVGFTESVSSHELVKLAREHKLPAIEDVGSGILLDLSTYGFSPEPTVQSVIEAGMDIVTFSGDKLLGGPQAGVIVGKKEYIDIIKKHPLNRAFRIDKLTLVALEATLKIYDDGENVLKRIPTLRMLTENKEVLYEKAKKLKHKMQLNNLDKVATIKIVDSFSQVGGGAMPLEQLPTYAVSIYSDNYTVNQLEKSLRYNKKPIFTRIYKEQISFDMRTILEEDIEDIVEALSSILLDIRQ